MNRPEAIRTIAKAFCSSHGTCPCELKFTRKPGAIQPKCHATIIYDTEAQAAVLALQKAGVAFESLLHAPREAQDEIDHDHQGCGPYWLADALAAPSEAKG